MDVYRIATDEEKGDCDEQYDLLLGPNGFECLLTEPEDRCWYRDLSNVIDELNKLHGQVAMLKAALGQ